MSKEELKLKGTNVEEKKKTTRKKAVSIPKKVDEKVEKTTKKAPSKKATETKKTTTTKKASTKKAEAEKDVVVKKVATKTKKETVKKAEKTAEVKVEKPKATKTEAAKKVAKTTKTAEPAKEPEKKAKATKSTKTEKSTKSTKTSASTKKAETKTTSAKKSSATKKETTKVAKKETSPKTTNSSKKSETNKVSKDIKDKKDNKVTPNTEKEIIKEETIIEKIKSFIAKIAAMQEEARKEALEAKEEKKTRKVAKKASKEVNETPVYLPEYYDLPYRYNETVVRILAQTPKKIFVYWDVADEDRMKYQRAFGNDFFEKTYPVLLVHNNDKGYTREIPINDFANSWYIDINDAKTNYTIQLGRKFKQIPVDIDVVKIETEHNIILRTDYLPIAQSNILEVPNDRILFAALPKIIKFRNVKTYEEKEKVVSEIKTTYGNMYNIREFYKENYKEEIDEEIIGLNNPSSGGLSSSSFK